jgi:hypothetical protein
MIMSVKNAFTDRIRPKVKVNQATGNRQQATGNRQQATGNRQPLYTPSKNHVNYLTVYIFSLHIKTINISHKQAYSA